jgi:hypothetical protein
VVVVLVAFGLATAVVALSTAKGSSSDRHTSEESRGMPILVRCPRAGDGHEHRLTTADEVIAVARRVNHREVTHYQGRAERRNRWNTPVEGLVMFLNGGLDVPGRRMLAVRAKQRCGKPGLASSAVTFYDTMSPVCCQTFTLFVAKGKRAWIVFGA